MVGQSSPSPQRFTTSDRMSTTEGTADVVDVPAPRQPNVSELARQVIGEIAVRRRIGIELQSRVRIAEGLAAQLGRELAANPPSGLPAILAELREFEGIAARLRDTATPMSSVDCRGVILLAEDHPEVRSLITVILERDGFAVLPAAHGGEALRYWDLYGPGIDLLVSDLAMPEIDGFELATRISRDRPELKILLTSATGHKSRDRLLASEQWPLLPKPFSPAQLRQEVSRLLGISSAPRTGLFETT